MNSNKMENFSDKKVENIIEASNIAIEPESGLAIVVIKPEALVNREQIIRRLENSGLYVVKTSKKILPENFVLGAMYRDLPEDIKEQTGRHFASGPSEIILLKGGENIIKDIVSATGLDTNPQKCDPESLRYLFGEHFPRETSAGNDYYRNAIHRGKNPDEQKDDLQKFQDVF